MNKNQEVEIEGFDRYESVKKCQNLYQSSGMWDRDLSFILKIWDLSKGI